MLRYAVLGLLSLGLAACASNEGQIREGGIIAARSVCPQLGIPAGTGSVTLFDPADSRNASAIDVTATMTNLRPQCFEDEASVVSTATFDVVAIRRDAGAARRVTLPIFNVAMRGGQQIVAKRVGVVSLDFAAGAIRATNRGQATIRVDRGAVVLPEEVREELTRRRRPGEIDAAIDPLSQPEVRQAVANATFEQLVGFQLTTEQLRYNATR